MKLKKYIIGIVQILSVVAISLGICIYTNISIGNAAALNNVKDYVSEMWSTRLQISASVADIQIEVNDADEIVVGDQILINDSINHEIRTVSGKTNNTLDIDQLINGYDINVRDVSVSVLTGITHSFEFQPQTSANIEKIRIELSNDSLIENASLANVQFGAFSGINEAAIPTHVVNNPVLAEFDADGAFINAGTSIGIILENIKNPDGILNSSYGIVISTLDADDDVIDSMTAYYVIDSGVTVKAHIDLFLEFEIEDDGIQNNSIDSATGVDIVLGQAYIDIVDDPINGRGIDGNKLIVTTNAVLGYNVTIEDSGIGLATLTYTGSRINAPSDEHFDDFMGGPSAWTGTGVEVYGYTVESGFDSLGISTNYTSFSSLASIIRNVTNAVSHDTFYVTVRSQMSIYTIPGVYHDTIIYTAVTNL